VILCLINDADGQFEREVRDGRGSGWRSAVTLLISLIAACSLRLSAFHLGANPPLVRPSRRLGLPSPLRRHRGLREQLVQTLARGVTVGRLRPVLATVDHQQAIARHPAAGEGRKPLLHVRRQRRSGNVNAQFDCGRHLVHILAARTGGAHEPFLNRTLGDRDLVGDADRRSTVRWREVAVRQDYLSPIRYRQPVGPIRAEWTTPAGTSGGRSPDV